MNSINGLGRIVMNKKMEDCVMVTMSPQNEEERVYVPILSWIGKSIIGMCNAGDHAHIIFNTNEVWQVVNTPSVHCNYGVITAAYIAYSDRVGDARIHRVSLRLTIDDALYCTFITWGLYREDFSDISDLVSQVVSPEQWEQASICLDKLLEAGIDTKDFGAVHIALMEEYKRRFGGK